MTENEEQQIYDDNVKIHLACLQLVSEKNLLRWASIDLGRQIYRSQVPETDSSSVVFSDGLDFPILVVGAVCNAVRDSLVIINQEHLNRVDCAPMSSIALPWWSGEIRDLWPVGWHLRIRERLKITINWNGKEKPGILDLIYLMMRY